MCARRKAGKNLTRDLNMSKSITIAPQTGDHILFVKWWTY